ncbi:unnamed protein product [Rhizoctonia solani]|uniref:Uncharacterized protein n=1 Tax=Rhizoctonia solani TaxID=456999 RepID=A0A8H3HW35_9AGAM|nr:unnamed protein product [Rhizoctonia solani]
MSRRSSRRINKVPYADLAEGQAEPSTRSRGKNLATDNRPGEGSTPIAGGEVADTNPRITDSTEAQGNAEAETDPTLQAVPNASTQTARPVRKPSTREANARARPCPAFFPDPAVHLAPGYAATYGLFAEQVLVKESGKRDTASTRKARENLGMNMGAGPLLDACEDLGWFKEAREERPVVYQGVHVKPSDCEIIQPSDAVSYFNDRIDVVKCLMGPFGHQQTVELKLFETLKLVSGQAIEHWRSTSETLYGDLIGVQHRKISQRAKHNYAQYLAVSTIPPTDPDASSSSPRKSNIQIWRFGPSNTPTDKTDQGAASCVLVLCLDDIPPARLLKWCPLPTNDENKPTGDTVRKLGILAGVFGDGAIRIYAVPDPASFMSDSEPAYVRLTRPLVHLALPDARFTYLDWGNSEVLAMGCSNGKSDTPIRARCSLDKQAISSYTTSNQLSKEPLTRKVGSYPFRRAAFLPEPRTSVKWIRLPSEPGEDPHMIVSGGFDGHIYVTDLRHPGGMPVSMYRCRDVIQAVAFSAYGAGIISNEHENMVKFTGLHPLVLGRGHNVSESRGPIWDIATSDLHPQVAVASSDGTLTIANLLKYVRKGSAMPSFIHTVYRMDLNRHTSELRMLDMLVPRDHKDYRNLRLTRKVPQGLAPADATPSQRAAAERERDGFGTWEPKIAIHCAAWQPSRLAQAGVLASGTASGLVRIDILREQVFNLRPQGEGADDDDDDDEPDDPDQS